MNALAVLLALACPLHAALLATVETTQGDVVVELQYDKAPQAVANFITLSQGTRGRIDPATGAITRAPLYIGEKFFRVINETTFKIAQTGSGTGTNSGGPGFTFKDEFHPSLTHVPYVLSMANSGPNSNGGQIFFTGNAPASHLNNVHTVFGLMTDPTSRAVIDAIHNAGNNGTTITGITFARSDPAALAFDEHAQNLPSLVQPAGQLAVSPGLSSVWNFSTPMTAGDVFHAFRSTTLAPGSWSELPTSPLHVGLTPPQSLAIENTAALDDASLPKAFYHLTVAHHPGAVAPSTLTNRTVVIPLSGGTLTYQFNATGSAGTTTYSPSTGDPIVGPFTTVNPNNGLPMEPTTSAHGIVFTADTQALNPRYLLVKVGCDSATDTQILGRHSTQYYGGFSGWLPFASGAVTISR